MLSLSIFCLFILFLNIENWILAGNVIQLNKKKYKGYLLRQVVFHFQWNPQIFCMFWCCPLEGWVENVDSYLKATQKLQNLPQNCKILAIKILWFLRIPGKKLMFPPWILSLDWELINNFLVLNSKTTQNLQNMWILAKNPQILHFLWILT